MPAYETRLLFVLRRAFWVGPVRRKHLMKDLGIKGTLATQLLREACNAFPLHLDLHGCEAVTRPGVDVHPKAEARLLMDLIAKGEVDPGILGFAAEPLFSVVRNAELPDERIMATLLRAAFMATALDIRYVSLRRQARGAWRCVVPLSFECHANQWRMHAHDLDAPLAEDGHVVSKWFILPRVLDVRPASRKMPRKSAMVYHMDSYLSFIVQFNHLLTDDQRRVLGREMALIRMAGEPERWQLQIREADVFDFRRKYMDNVLQADQASTSNVVWPLVEKLLPIT